MTVPEKTRSELVELSRQLPSLAELARDRQKLPLFVVEYQHWYTRAARIVALLGQDRLAEFEGYYLADPKRRTVDDSTFCIQDYLLGVQTSYPLKMDIPRAVVLRLTTQVSILQSLESRLEGVFADIRGEMLADFEESEIDSARKILKVSPRAAGAMTAAVLETHLLRVARYHGVKISTAKPTVAYLNDMLKKAGICNDENWRSIRLLLDQQKKILNDKKTDPETEAVADLISQLGKILKVVV